MKSSLAISSLLYGLAVANPLLPRTLDIGDYEEVANAVSAIAAPVGDAVPETTVAYNPTSVITAIVAQVTDADPAQVTVDTGKIVTLARRAAACTSRSYNGPLVRPSDTPEAFQANTAFADAATAAADAPNVPEGYASVPDFVNLQAAAKDPSYLTYVSSKLTSYNASQCAAICDSMAGCNSFNICKSAWIVNMGTKS